MSEDRWLWFWGAISMMAASVAVVVLDHLLPPDNRRLLKVLLAACILTFLISLYGMYDPFFLSLLLAKTKIRPQLIIALAGALVFFGVVGYNWLFKGKPKQQKITVREYAAVMRAKTQEAYMERFIEQSLQPPTPTPLATFKNLFSQKIAQIDALMIHPHDKEKNREWYWSVHKLLRSAITPESTFSRLGRAKEHALSNPPQRKPILELFEVRSPLNGEPQGENQLTIGGAVDGSCSFCSTLLAYKLFLTSFLDDVTSADMLPDFRAEDYK